MLVNGKVLGIFVSMKDGGVISHADATDELAAAYGVWDFAGTWTRDYTSFNVDPKTDLPILKAFPADLQPPRIVTIYVVEFVDGLGGDSMESATFLCGVVTNLPASTYTRTGYTQTGWTNTFDGGVMFDLEAEISDDLANDGETVTLTAVWELLPGWYVVTLEDKRNVTFHEVVAEFGQPMPSTGLPAPTSAGMLFLGYVLGPPFDSSYWFYYDADMAGARDWDYEGDATLTAMWTAETRVAYMANGGAFGVVPASFFSRDPAGGFYVIPDIRPTRAGYSFDGWNTESDGGGTPVDNATEFTPGSSPQIVYAKWAPLNSTWVEASGISVAGNVVTLEWDSADALARLGTITSYVIYTTTDLTKKFPAEWDVLEEIEEDFTVTRTLAPKHFTDDLDGTDDVRFFRVEAVK